MQTTDRSTRSSKRGVPPPVPDHELQSSRSSSGDFMCIECSETFDNKLELNSHRQSHVTKKQFTCAHCGRGFHHQVFLQMHERSHEDGLPHTSLAKNSAGRVMSTRSSKSTQDADIIHVAPAISKSTYHLNSRVEFKSGVTANQDVLPRECVTRRTQGTSPAYQKRDGSDKKSQFELRISKLSDRNIHLVDPYGNTLEILAEVFNTYTIGEPDDDDEEEDESMSPTGDSRASPSLPPSPVPLNIETTHHLGDGSSPQAEGSEPCEPMSPGDTEEDLPLRHIESVSSASVSPKTMPDLSDEAEELPPPHQNSSISAPGDGKEPSVVTAEDLSLIPADPRSAQLVYSEVLHGGHISTGDSLVSKPLTPDPLMTIQGSTSPLPALTRSAIDTLLTVPPSDLLLDINEDSVDLLTTCMKDIQDLQGEHEEPRRAEVPCVSQDQSHQGEDTASQTTLNPNKCAAESDEHHEDVVRDSITSDPCDSDHDGELHANLSAANNDGSSPLNIAKDGNDNAQSKADVCSGDLGVPDETCRPVDVCMSEPSPPKISMMSVNISDLRSATAPEERSGNRDNEKVHLTLEKPVSAITTHPILHKVQSPPEPCQEQLGGDLVLNNPSSPSEKKSVCELGGSLPLEVQPLSRSNLEQDLNLRDIKVVGPDISFSNVGLISSSEVEESPVQGNDPAMTTDELTACINKDSSHENPQTLVHVAKGGDHEMIAALQKIPSIASGAHNPMSLPESKEVGVGYSFPPTCEDVVVSTPSLVSITSSCIGDPEHELLQEAKSCERDLAERITGGETLSSRSTDNIDLKEDVLLVDDTAGASLCLLDEALEISPDLKVLSEKCLLSSEEVKDLIDNDIDKSLHNDLPPKQYIQMSNADLTENDLADDLGTGAVLLDAPSTGETPKDDDISALSGEDETTVHELSEILSPDIQDSEYSEGLDDKHVGIGSQCVKCGRQVRRGRKELVWFPDCYKCRLKTKREERRSGEGTCHSPEMTLETDRKKGFSSFHIKQEVDLTHDNAFYKTAKPPQSTHSMNPRLPRKMFKCTKCEKSFRLPTLLASHMKSHTLPQCLGCGCPMTLKCKTKRIPKRCHKCFQNFKELSKEETSLGGDGEEESLESDGGSLYVDEVDDDDDDDDDKPENDLVDPKPGSITRGTEPFHCIFLKKHKKMSPTTQALYCSCDVLTTGDKQSKICKNCQRPVRRRLVQSDQGMQVKESKSPSDQHDLPGESSVTCDTELSPDDDEEIEPFPELDTSDQLVPLDGEKPRLCPQCGKIFKCNRSMNLHLLSHTAAQCESCGCRLQKKKRAGRWSKKCRVCRLLTKDNTSVEEDLPTDKIIKDKNVASLHLKMKQSKIVRKRKVHAIGKNHKELKWRNMILAAKGMTRKPRKKMDQTMKNPDEEQSGYSSEPTGSSGDEDKVGFLKDFANPSRMPTSKKKIVGGISKADRKCMYRERNIIKVEEQQLPPYIAHPSSTPVLVKEEEENQCLECNEVFANFELLLGHQQSHVADHPFTCSQCPQSFSTEQYLSIHISAHAEGPPFRCPECNKTFTRRNHLGVHRRVHTGARPYACPDCPCRFRQKGSLIIHRYTHRNLQFMLSKPFQCSVCKKSFKQKERLTIHERIHTGECPFSCKDCDKVFPSKSRLYVHRKIHKIAEGASGVEHNAICKDESRGHPFQCKDCDKICSTKASFVLHCKVHKSPAICDQSGRLEEKTEEAPLVSEHNRIIKTEPEGHPFGCKDCNKICSTKASLVLHRKVHGMGQRSDGGSPAFICKDCHKVCSTKASLVLHRKVHKSPLMPDLKANIGDPPYICQDCNKVCSTKASFVLHSKVHRSSQSLVKTQRDATGEHPFTCKDCNKVCCSKASLVRHSKVHKAIPATADHSSPPQPEVEEKPYHCKECGKIYSTKGRLMSHIKLHAGQDASADGGEQLKIDTEEKPFACSVCHMRFTRLKILVRHKLLHGEDVFRCAHCAKRFLFQKSLMNHVQVCLKRSKGKEKAHRKRKIKDGSSGDESAPKRPKSDKKVATVVQKLKHKKLIKAKKLAINKEKGKAKSSCEKKPKKAKGEAEREPEPPDQEHKDEKPLENLAKMKKVVKERRQKVTSDSLRKWRIIAAATVKKRKLQAAMSGGSKKVTVKKKGPSKPKPGGKSNKE